MIAAIIPTTYPYDDWSKCVAYIKVANPHESAIITDPMYRIDLATRSEKEFILLIWHISDRIKKKFFSFIAYH